MQNDLDIPLSIKHLSVSALLFQIFVFMSITFHRVVHIQHNRYDANDEKKLLKATFESMFSVSTFMSGHKTHCVCYVCSVISSFNQSGSRKNAFSRRRKSRFKS
jgi:hypothetical protein